MFLLNSRIPLIFISSNLIGTQDFILAIIRATLSCERTELCCRLPLLALFYLTKDSISWRPVAVMSTIKRILFFVFPLIFMKTSIILYTIIHMTIVFQC